MFRRICAKTIATLVALFCGSTVLAADFRDASWGMSMRDVLALHPGELPADRKIGYLTFDSKLARLDVKIYYRFDSDGELFQAGYEIRTEDKENSVVAENLLSDSLIGLVKVLNL